MGYYLLDHKNKYAPKHADGQYWGYERRSGTVVAIVVHITAGLEDLDGVDDLSAENTARYASTTSTKVSWHSGSDADSALDLLPADHVAFQCIGYNSRTYGHEISKRHTDWRTSPPAFVEATLTRAATHLAPKARSLGVPLRHATKAEVDRAIATNGAPVGFIDHALLDPTRRTDPGIVNKVDTFPWSRFFELMQPAPIPPTIPTWPNDFGGTPVHTSIIEIPLDGSGVGSAPICPEGKLLSYSQYAEHDKYGGDADTLICPSGPHLSGTTWRAAANGGAAWANGKAHALVTVAD